MTNVARPTNKLVPTINLIETPQPVQFAPLNLSVVEHECCSVSLSCMQRSEHCEDASLRQGQLPDSTHHSGATTAQACVCGCSAVQRSEDQVSLVCVKPASLFQQLVMLLPRSSDCVIDLYCGQHGGIMFDRTGQKSPSDSCLYAISRQSRGAAGAMDPPHAQQPRQSVLQWNKGLEDIQRKRRKEALQRQQDARRAAADRARHHAMGPAAAEDSSSDANMQQAEEPQQGITSASKAQAFAKQLMQLEWMVDVPEDLHDWYVLPRPFGRRFLVTAAGGRTVSRSRLGRVLHRFLSPLPGGSPQAVSGSDCFTIVDTIFHEADNTYYVLDLMCWGGYGLWDCAAAFRQYWLASKLAEAVAPGTGRQPEHPLQLVPAALCTPDALKRAHQGPLTFQRDGLLFLHKEGHYAAGEASPLALLWKDAACSPYLLDTNPDGSVPEQQQVVLAYQQDGTLATSDEPPAPLGHLPQGFLQKHGKALRPGQMLRCTLGPGGVQLHGGQAVGADLSFAGVASQRRGRADTLSKILFQHMARTQPLGVERLAAACLAAGQGHAQPAQQQGQQQVMD